MDSELILASAFRFEKERGQLDSFFESRLEGSGLSGKTVEEVAKPLTSYIKSHITSETELLSSALFALGKSYDSSHSKLYTQVMKNSQKTNPVACYQAAIALENTGVLVFPGGADVSKQTEFLRDINAYLVKHAL